MARRGQRRAKLVRQLTSVVLTEKQLHQCLAKWQKILRLQDWDIRLHLARHSEMHNGQASGEISVFDLKKIATIHILHMEDFNLIGAAETQDMEYTLVHELMHIYLHPMKCRQVDEEQAVHRLATALVALSRGAYS